MQITFGKILNWFTSNKLVVNLNRTKNMLFTLKSNLPLDILLAVEQVEFVMNYTFLGCIIDAGHTWKEHANSVCKKDGM